MRAVQSNFPESFTFGRAEGSSLTTYEISGIGDASTFRVQTLSSFKLECEILYYHTTMERRLLILNVTF